MVDVVRYGTEEIEYSITDNSRLISRIRIHVNPNGRIEVEKPPQTQLVDVRTAVQKRARWIVRTRQAAGDARKHSLPRHYVSGESHFYLGRRYKLIVSEEGRTASTVRLWRGRIVVTLPIADPAAVRRRLKHWYRERAEAFFARKLTELVGGFQGIDVQPGFQLLAMEKQWGSCSPAGRVSLNPALIKAPTHCVEYVMVHELCHLLEHNHSKRFYRLLDRHCPDWQERKQELDGLAEQLLVD